MQDLIREDNTANSNPL